MEKMQGMMQQMQDMMGRGGTRDRGGMMVRQGMGITAQEEEEDEEDNEEASSQRAMMGRRGMMGLGGMRGPGGMVARHMARLAQQLELTDEQQAQVRMLLRNHAKEAIRLRADIGVMAVDLQHVLDTDPVDLPKAKQFFQSMAMKEADLRLAHIALMQEWDSSASTLEKSCVPGRTLWTRCCTISMRTLPIWSCSQRINVPGWHAGCTGRWRNRWHAVQGR